MTESREAVTSSQISGPDGLRLLADWFDATRPNEPDQVQRDLRKWADDMDAAARALQHVRTALQMHNGMLHGKECWPEQDEIDAVLGR